MAQAEMLFGCDVSDLHLVKQGAEAKIYSCIFRGKPTIIKERFQKTYRHPVLDKSLTIRRTRAETRCFQRCQTAGLRCPEVYFVDSKKNAIYMENIVSSVTVKDYLQEKLKTRTVFNNSLTGSVPDEASTTLSTENTPKDEISTLLPLAEEIGRILGTMHRHHIIHGDLTTSNLLLEGRPEDWHIALIDFGLGSYAESAEDKGVDLYVLERALLSTHPNTERLFEAILSSYRIAYSSSDGQESSGKKGGKKPTAEQVLNKLEEVRMRGRKRTMVG